MPLYHILNLKLKTKRLKFICFESNKAKYFIKSIIKNTRNKQYESFRIIQFVSD